MKKRKHGVKVFQLKTGLDASEAYSAICCRVRGIFFKFWSYDRATGKARAMG